MIQQYICIFSLFWRIKLPACLLYRHVYVRTPALVCLSVCMQDYSKTRVWVWMKCCVSTDVGTWSNWLTFEPDSDHSPDAGTGFLPPISYRLRNIAALLSLAYFSAISVSICIKLARSILITDRNTATQPNFRKKRFL